MHDNYTPQEEVQAHRHPLLPDSERYRLTRILHDCDLESGLSKLILHLSHQETGERRVLAFDDARCDHLLVHICGLYVLDIQYRGWEGLRVEVGEFFEEGGICFFAKSVRDVTSETI